MIFPIAQHILDWEGKGVDDRSERRIVWRFELKHQYGDCDRLQFTLHSAIPYERATSRHKWVESNRDVPRWAKHKPRYYSNINASKYTDSPPEIPDGVIQRFKQLIVENMEVTL